MPSLDRGCKLAYIVEAEAWYADELGPIGLSEARSLTVKAAHDDGSAAWEFAVEERDLGGPMTRAMVSSDAYAAFVQVPEFFKGLAARRPGTLREVISLLDELGAADRTPRVAPGRPDA